MQAAAIAFVDQLRADDRVMVMSFDDRLEVLSELTNDRAQLRRSIRETRTGGGTRLYDAVDFIINKRVKIITGRKAIVLFTDGVDTTSRRASYESTVRDADELDALIYSVQYSTFGGGGIVVGNGGGWPFPRRRGGGILNLPFPFPMPLPGPVPGSGGGGGNGSRGEHDRGTAYLNDLAMKTGARVNRADSLPSIEQSFALIAEELRRQYSIGYYPKKLARAGERRQIKVRMREPNLVVRARDSYIFGRMKDEG
ncbi:MAG: VWA domain-containing protein [Pyrinomonadaceae bacterium]